MLEDKATESPSLTRTILFWLGLVALLLWVLLLAYTVYRRYVYLPYRRAVVVRERRLLVHCLELTTRALEHAEVRYWMCAGTLLGAVRHQAIIPHDDDFDLDVYGPDMDDLDKLGKLRTLLTTWGVRLQSSALLGHQVVYGNQSGDLFHRYRNDKQQRFDGYRATNLFWPKECITYERLGDLTRLPRLRIEHLSLPAPTRAEEHLCHVYGNDVLEVACIYPTHSLHDLLWSLFCSRIYLPVSRSTNK